MLKIFIRSFSVLLVLFCLFNKANAAEQALSQQSRVALCDMHLNLRIAGKDFQVDQLNPEMMSFMMNALRLSDAKSKGESPPAELAPDQVIAQQKSLAQKYQEQISRLEKEMKDLGMTSDIVAGVIEQAELFREIHILFESSRNVLAAGNTSTMSPYWQMRPELSAYDQIIDEVTTLIPQSRSFDSVSSLEQVANYLASLKASSETRSEELIYILLHNIRHIITNKTSNESALRLAKKALNRNFLAVEKAYLTIINARKQIWQLEHLSDRSGNPIQPKLRHKLMISRLKKQISLSLESLGRNFPQYKAARQLLEKMADPSQLDCSNISCREISKIILENIGITQVELNRRFALLNGKRPSLEEIEFMYNYNPEAIEAQFKLARTLGIWDSFVRTPFYLFANFRFINSMINWIPSPKVRKFFKFFWHMFENIKAISSHFKQLSDVLEFPDTPSRFEKLVKVNANYPGIMETAARLLGFPWDELKKYCEEKSKSNEKAEMYKEFLTKMNEAETYGREYGLLSYDSNIAFIQTTTAYLTFEMVHHKVFKEYFALDNAGRTLESTGELVRSAYLSAIHGTSYLIELLTSTF